MSKSMAINWSIQDLSDMCKEKGLEITYKTRVGELTTLTGFKRIL